MGALRGYVRPQGHGKATGSCEGIVCFASADEKSNRGSAFFHLDSPSRPLRKRPTVGVKPLLRFGHRFAARAFHGSSVLAIDSWLVKLYSNLCPSASPTPARGHPAATGACHASFESQIGFADAGTRASCGYGVIAGQGPTAHWYAIALCMRNSVADATLTLRNPAGFPERDESRRYRGLATRAWYPEFAVSGAAVTILPEGTPVRGSRPTPRGVARE